MRLKPGSHKLNKQIKQAKLSLQTTVAVFSSMDVFRHDRQLESQDTQVMLAQLRSIRECFFLFLAWLNSNIRHSLFYPMRACFYGNIELPYLKNYSGA